MITVEIEQFWVHDGGNKESEENEIAHSHVLQVLIEGLVIICILQVALQFDVNFQRFKLRCCDKFNPFS
jgi:hypothetical protein